MTRTATATAIPVAVDAPSDLATLIKQRRALDAQIQRAKATHVNLAKDIVRRLGKRVRTRINAGQSQDDALEQVFSAYRAAVASALATAPADDEPDETSA